MVVLRLWKSKLLKIEIASKHNFFPTWLVSWIHFLHSGLCLGTFWFKFISDGTSFNYLSSPTVKRFSQELTALFLWFFHWTCFRRSPICQYTVHVGTTSESGALWNLIFAPLFCMGKIRGAFTVKRFSQKLTALAQWYFLTKSLN